MGRKIKATANLHCRLPVHPERRALQVNGALPGPPQCVPPPPTLAPSSLFSEKCQLQELVKSPALVCKMSKS